MTARPQHTPGPIVHYRNIRLFVNAGMGIPECKAYAPLLDCDSGRWAMSGDRSLVTCKRCMAAIRKARGTV